MLTPLIKIIKESIKEDITEVIKEDIKVAIKEAIMVDIKEVIMNYKCKSMSKILGYKKTSGIVSP
jgi:hypothetical protein